MNCQLRDITVTARDGRVSHLDQVYIRGSHVRYFIVPDMLRSGIEYPCNWSNNTYTDAAAGMRPCSGREMSKAGVWDLPEVVRRSVGQEEAEGLDEERIRKS